MANISQATINDNTSGKQTSGKDGDDGRGPKIAGRATRWRDNGFDGDLISTRVGDKRAFETGWNASTPWDFNRVLRNALQSGCNVGLRTTKYPAVDIEDTQYADFIFEVAKQFFPNAPVRSRDKSNSRALLLRRADGETPKKFSLITDDGSDTLVLEVLGKTQLHIIGPRDDKGGVWLSWDREPKAAELHVVTNSEIELFVRGVKQKLLADKGVATKIHIQDETNYGDGAGGAVSEKDVDSDWIVALFDEMGMVLDRRPNTRGFIGIECPWSHEHTNPAENLAGYLPGIGGFSCLHTHCSHRGMPELRGWIEDNSTPEARAKAANKAAKGDFDPVPFEDKADHLSKEWKQAIARLRASRDEPGQDAFYGGSGDEGFVTFDFNENWATPYVRPDISDWHARGECSVLASAPGTGKSTLVSLYAAAICLDRPDLVGLSKLDWTGDVVIVSNEDRFASISRKLAAYRKKLGVSGGGKHKVHLWSERLAVVSKSGALGLAPTRDAVRFVDRLADLRRASSVCMVVIDTLASAVEGGDENSVGDMQGLLNCCGDLALGGFCSVVLVHHVRKAGGGEVDDSVSLNDLRGSSAIGGAVRAGVGIVRCGEKRRDEFGWTEDERRRTIRFDGIKANDRTLASEKFFRFETVNLVAEDPRDPTALASVDVGVLSLLPTPVAVKVDWKTRAKDCLDLDLRGGVPLTLDTTLSGPYARQSAVAHVIDAQGGDRKKDRAAVRQAILDLIAEGVFTTLIKHDAKRNEKTFLACP